MQPPGPPPPYASPDAPPFLPMSDRAAVLELTAPLPAPTPAVRPARLEWPSEPRVLIVDDEEANARVLRRLLQLDGFQLTATVTDPRQALATFHVFRPDLVLLDLNMPHVDGFTLLQAVRDCTGPDEFLPVLVLTGEQDRTACERALSLGANDFIAKPFELAETRLRIRNLLETRRLHLTLEQHRHGLEARVAERTAELEAAQFEMMERLARAADFRDDATGEHTRRVGDLAAELALAAGLPRDEAELIRRAAPLHDVGKIGVPDAILLKPGPLTPDERTAMEQHTLFGAAILSGGRCATVRLAETIALAHHERWDGSGYPYGVLGEAIPLAARIVAIVDVYDALTNVRPYRPALPGDEVVRLMRADAGRHFDPRLLEIFLSRCVDREA